MSRYKGPRLKITRRLGELPGLTRKKSIRKKTNVKKKIITIWNSFRNKTKTPISLWYYGTKTYSIR